MNPLPKGLVGPRGSGGGACIPFSGNVLGAERCKLFPIPPNQEDVMKSGIDITNMGSIMSITHHNHTKQYERKKEEMYVVV